MNMIVNFLSYDNFIPPTVTAVTPLQLLHEVQPHGMSTFGNFQFHSSFGQKKKLVKILEKAQNVYGATLQFNIKQRRSF